MGIGLPGRRLGAGGSMQHGEQFGWPRVLGQAVTVPAFFGFFLVLVVAWYHGEKGRHKVSGPELIMIVRSVLRRSL